jgi:TRAP-type C4-dicarboxylate transport system, small permease component
MQGVVKIIDKILAQFVTILAIAATIVVVWQVGTRMAATYLSVGKPSVYTEELARFLLMWIGLIGAAFVAGQKRHLAIDIILVNLKGTPKIILEKIILLAVLAFTGVIMLYGGGVLVWETLSKGQLSPVLGIPMGLVYCAIPLSGLLIVFYTLVHLFDRENQIEAPVNNTTS